MEKPERKLLKIGEIAERAGVTVRTIRYYEELGLLDPSEISVGGFRLFTEDDLRKLLFIRRFKELKFPLEEIKLLLNSALTGKEKSEKISSSFFLLQKQLEQVNNKIAELGNIKSSILEALSMLEACKNCEQQECSSKCPNQKAIF